jgi:hypothetical protein
MPSSCSAGNGNGKQEHDRAFDTQIKIEDENIDCLLTIIILFVENKHLFISTLLFYATCS